MPTVKEIAEQLQAVETINRALLFDDRYRCANIWAIPVEWSYKLKSAAGNANRWRIHLHPGLQSASEAEFRAIFLHELAHVLDCITRGHSGHDYGWQEAMIRLGQKPVRTHNITSCRNRAAKQNGVLDLDL